MNSIGPELEIPTTISSEEISSSTTSSNSKPKTPYEKVTSELRHDEEVRREISQGKRVGLYRLCAVLGRGSFSQVKRGVHVLTGEQVAVKILDKCRFDTKTQKLLSREMSNMEHLHHPNIIRLYEVIDTPYKLHFVLEYAAGGDLFTKIVTSGAFREDYAKCIFAQLTSAMDYMDGFKAVLANLYLSDPLTRNIPTLVYIPFTSWGRVMTIKKHGNGIIHRDLKAENIYFAASSPVQGLSPLFSSSSCEGLLVPRERIGRLQNQNYTPRQLHVKVGDFGFSTMTKADEHLTTFCGSPPYAAPELFRDAWYLGPPVDVWAMGVLLYFILTSMMPFRGETISRLRRIIMEGYVFYPRYITAAAKDLLIRMLHMNPVERITVSQVRSHIWLSGETFPEPLDDFPQNPVALFTSSAKLDESTSNNNNNEVAVLKKRRAFPFRMLPFSSGSGEYPTVQKKRSDLNSYLHEVKRMLQELGITEEHLSAANSVTPESCSPLTGTYRIVLHRLDRARRLSNIAFKSCNDISSTFTSRPPSSASNIIHPVGDEGGTVLTNESAEGDPRAGKMHSRACHIL